MGAQTAMTLQFVVNTPKRSNRPGKHRSSVHVALHIDAMYVLPGMGVHEPLYIYTLPDIDIARGSFVKKEMASASDLFGAGCQIGSKLPRCSHTGHEPNGRHHRRRWLLKVYDMFQSFRDQVPKCTNSKTRRRQGRDRRVHFKVFPPYSYLTKLLPTLNN